MRSKLLFTVLILALLAAAGVAAVPTPASDETKRGHSPPNADIDIVDITGTPTGIMLRIVQAVRQVSRGLQPSDKKKVFRIGDLDDYLVVGDATTIEDVTATYGPDGAWATLGVQMRIQPDAKSNSPTALLFSPTWELNNSDCPSRINADFGWMDTCWQIWNLANDGNGSKDYWDLRTWATAKGEDSALDYAWLLTDEHAASDPMSWEDWSPRSDESGGSCSTISISISVGATLTFYHTRCETWEIDKWSDAAHFKSQYDGNAWDSEREVSHQVTTSVDEGDSPVWSLYWEVRACAGWCDTASGP